MEARNLIADAVRTPEQLKIIGQAFAEAWAAIGRQFDGDEERSRGRLRLVQAVLAVAQEDDQTVEGIKNSALKAMSLP